MTLRPALLLALSLAGFPNGAKAGGMPLNRRIDDIFAPYRHEATPTDAEEWTRPIFSANVTRLIAAWRKTVRPGKVSSVLEEAGWFCQCQDWDAASFRILHHVLKSRPDGRVQADILFDLGDGTAREDRILFAREGERWKVADLFTPVLPKGLNAALRAAIVEGEAR